MNCCVSTYFVMKCIVFSKADKIGTRVVAIAVVPHSDNHVNDDLYHFFVPDKSGFLKSLSF